MGGSMDNPTLSHPQLQIHLGSQPTRHSFVQNPHTQEKHANATKKAPASQQVQIQNLLAVRGLW